MTVPTSCPDPSRWKALLEGSLPDDAQAALQGHLETCAQCQQTLEGLAADSAAWARAARHLDEVHQAGEAALQRVVAELEAEGDPPTNPTEARPDEARSDEARPDEELPLDFLSPPQKPGELGRLGHYDILEVTGRGGMGIVLKAFDQVLQRVVAIKVMAPSLASSATARQRFVREARAAAAVRNEHVMAIYAVEEAGTLPYLVMEYVAGMSLQERLDWSGPLGTKEILRIGMQTATGLAAAHAQGLIHRDIKPANILLENGVERVKITDFGLARAVDDASVTQSGVIAGTPQYMAPEQAQGAGLDQRTDLFSLGSVLYALCTGRPPFRANGTLAVLKRVCEDTPRAIAEINPEIPEWLTAIISKLQDKKPDDRFQSAAEVAQLLAQHMAHLQQPGLVPAPAHETGRQADQETRRKKGWGFLSLGRSRRRPVAVALLVLAGGLSLTEATGVTKVAATFIRILTPEDEDGKQVVQAGMEGTTPRFQFTPPPPGPLDQFDPAQIPAAERFPWQPKELVAVLGEHRARHWTGLLCATFSPDGKLVASSDWDKNISLWEADTLRPRAMLSGHQDWVWSVAFATDGRRLLSGSVDKTVRLWDVDEGRELRRFEGHTDAVWSVALSPDGRRAVSGGADRTVRLWDVETGNELSVFQGHTAVIHSVAFSPNGFHVLSGSSDHTMRLWDIKTGQEVRCFEGHTDNFRIVAFLPDGLRAISCSHDRTVRLWNVETGKQIRRFNGHQAAVHFVAVSRDGCHALSGGRDATSTPVTVGCAVCIYLREGMRVLSKRFLS